LLRTKRRGAESTIHAAAEIAGYLDARLAYILGDLLEMTDQEGAEALEISPPPFRQRLARAHFPCAGGAGRW